MRAYVRIRFSRHSGAMVNDMIGYGVGPGPGGGRAANEAINNVLSERLVTRMFATRLARKTTNWANCHWLGQRCRQNVLDLWTSQETLSEIHPALLIETGTNRGGAALYFAHLFDLMGHSRLLTIDVAKMHDLTHILVQDGIIDELPSFARDRPGPLPAIRRFLLQHPGFEVDHARCDRFLVTQHPMGWLRRRSNEHAA